MSTVPAFERRSPFPSNYKTRSRARRRARQRRRQAIEGQGPVIDLLDLLEALPVVLRSARFDRGLDDYDEAAKAIGIHARMIMAIERGEGNQGTQSLIKILEWLGPMSRQEWDELRFADTPAPALKRDELLQELAAAMAGPLDDPDAIALRVHYPNRLSLARRLWRMGENELANYFEVGRPHEPPSPTAAQVTSPLARVMLAEEDYEASTRRWSFLQFPSS